MNYTISQTPPNLLSTEEIFGEIASFKHLAVEVVNRWVILLQELSTRKVSHPHFYHPLLKFWKSLADETLSTEAAMLLMDNDKSAKGGKMIRAVLPLPVADQVEIAHGRPITVASMNEAGEIVNESVQIQRMSDATLKRAFCSGGIRPVQEQEEILHKEGQVKRYGMIIVLPDEGKFKIGNQKFAPENLNDALVALGYAPVQLARNVPAKPDAQPSARQPH